MSNLTISTTAIDACVNTSSNNIFLIGMAIFILTIIFLGLYFKKRFAVILGALGLVVYSFSISPCTELGGYIIAVAGLFLMIFSVLA